MNKLNKLHSLFFPRKIEILPIKEKKCFIKYTE